MENELSTQLQDRFSSLPHEFQDFIASEKVKNIISETLAGQPLQQKQIDIFERELMFVLLGLETVSSFTDNIKQNMEISISRADELSKNIKQKIFVPFQDSLILEVPQQKMVLPKQEENSKHTQQEVQEPVIPQAPQMHDSYKEPIEDAEKSESLPVPQKEPVDIFKKRLTESVHTPIEQKIIADKQQERPEPATHEELTNDQYRETPI